MPKSKNAGRRGTPKESGDTVKPSPAAEARMNARLNGGVTELNDQVGPERSTAKNAMDMVTIPRLDHTIIYGGQKFYPSEEPIEIPYGAAFTYGLIGAADGASTGRTQGQSLVTDEDREKSVAANDNGHGGEGAPAGNQVPASSVADQAPTRDEIDEAGKAQGTDPEAAIAAREAEIQARRQARTGFEPG